MLFRSEDVLDRQIGHACRGRSSAIAFQRQGHVGTKMDACETYLDSLSYLTVTVTHAGVIEVVLNEQYASAMDIGHGLMQAGKNRRGVGEIQWVFGFCGMKEDSFDFIGDQRSVESPVSVMFDDVAFVSVEQPIERDIADLIPRLCSFAQDLVKSSDTEKLQTGHRTLRVIVKQLKCLHEC